LIGALPPAQRPPNKIVDPFLFNPHRHLTLPPVILPSSTTTTTTAILPPPLTPSSKTSPNPSLVEPHSLANPQPQPVEPSTSTSSQVDPDTGLPSASETLIHPESQSQSQSGGLDGDKKEDQASVLKTSSVASTTLVPDPIHPTIVKSAVKSDPKSAASGLASGSSASGSLASGSGSGGSGARSRSRNSNKVKNHRS
jgi:uncharacterized membrane protein YgcG